MAQSLLTKSFLTTGRGVSALVLTLGLLGPLTTEAHAQRSFGAIREAVRSSPSFRPSTPTPRPAPAPSAPAPRPVQSHSTAYRAATPPPQPHFRQPQYQAQQVQAPQVQIQQPAPQVQRVPRQVERHLREVANQRPIHNAPIAQPAAPMPQYHRQEPAPPLPARQDRTPISRGDLSAHHDRTTNPANPRDIANSAAAMFPMKRKSHGHNYYGYGHGYAPGYDYDYGTGYGYNSYYSSNYNNYNHGNGYGYNYGYHRPWNRYDWRRERRHDWQDYRRRNRSRFSIGFYYSPYSNYNYQPLSVGIVLSEPFFSDRYWINNPSHYRLPEAYGSYRWVRYYNDVVLVDLYSGAVVDVVYNFFW